MCRAKTGNPCQFPFTYKGREYNTCITADHIYYDHADDYGYGVYWCYYDQEEGLWGNCDCNSLMSNCTSACPGNLVLTVQCNYNEDQPL